MNDILLDTDYEIQITVDGDLKVADTEQQNVEFIVRARKGQYYQWPKLGIGIEAYNHGNVNKQALRQEVKLQLESDNYRVNEVQILGSIDELNMSIDAERLR